MNRDDIAKQFELPERRSKIATLLKQDQSDEVYCICRSSDSSRFMIACDSCEEWYHGDCIGVTERESRHIKRFYCDRCRTADPQLSIRYKSSRHGTERSGHSEPASGLHSRPPPADCGKCSACRDNASSEYSGRRRRCKRRQCEHSHRSAGDKSDQHDAGATLDTETGASAQRHHRPNRIVDDDEEDDGDALWQPSAVSERKRPAHSTSSGTAATGRSRQQHQSRHSPAAKKRRRHSSSADGAADWDGARSDSRRSRKTSAAAAAGGQSRQCYGPQCVLAARPNSRYCSDQCGLSLARNRIFQVLPQRIQEWNMTRCAAEEHNTRQLEQIRRCQLEAQAQLERLARLHSQLDRLVERGRRLAVDPGASDADDDDETANLHCVTCGHEVSRRLALRHMDRCYAKHESQTSFGSLYQTRVEGFNMFCDFYQASTGTYCKRLRVLCPEHCKNPKVGDNESCGCPLLGKNFDPNGQVCRVAKKKCNKHVGWEKLRRAELDMERVRWAMKMDELMEQERQCRQSMADRAGVLALMLHSTYDHDIMEKVQNQQRKMARKSQTQVAK